MLLSHQQRVACGRNRESCHGVMNFNRVQRSSVRRLATVPRPEELKQAVYTQSLLVARATSAGYASFDYEELLPGDVDNCPHGYVEGGLCAWS
jgi:hypothetical protein